MSRRSRAREVALQLLFQHDLNPENELNEQAFATGRLRGNEVLVEFAQALLAGVLAHRESLDEALQKATHNWRLARLSTTDRNVLRLAAFEILFFGTPAKVAMNEAIDLARRYGNADSPKFVNGVLDRLFRSQSESIVPQESPAEPAESPLNDLPLEMSE